MQITRNSMRQRGQGMTEYIIIVALIAVAAIGVYSYFGQTIKAQTSAMTQEMAGQDGKAANDIAKGAGTKAEGLAKDKQTLGNYTGNAKK